MRVFINSVKDNTVPASLLPKDQNPVVDPSVGFSFNHHLVSSTFIKTSLVLTGSAHHHRRLDTCETRPAQSIQDERGDSSLIGGWKYGRGRCVCFVAVGSPEVVCVLLNPDLTLQNHTSTHTTQGKKTPYALLWSFRRKIHFKSLRVSNNLLTVKHTIFLILFLIS